MKAGKRFLSVVLSLFLLGGLLPTGAAAATTSSKHTINIKKTTVTLRVSKEVTLEYTTSKVKDPDDSKSYLEYDGDILWTSSHSDVAEVDQNGIVTANSAGVTTIYARLDNGKRDSCEIIVPGLADWASYGYYYDRVSGSYVPMNETQLAESTTGGNVTSNGVAIAPNNPVYNGVLSTTGNSDTVTLGGTASLNEVVSAAKADRNTAVMNDFSAVAASTLKEAAKYTKNVAFDSRLGKRVVGRITIPAASIQSFTGTIKTGVFASVGNSRAAQEKFNRLYKNDLIAVQVEQEKFADTVRICVKVNNLSSKNLVVYSYDAKKNTIKKIDSKTIIDSNDYLHFYTTVGGSIIVSDGALRKK